MSSSTGPVSRLRTASPRTQQSLLSIAGGWFFTAATMASGAVATPFVLAALGAERFGAFRAIADAFGYPALLEAGLTGSVMACLAKALASHEDASSERVLGAARRAYGLITGAVLIAGAALVAALPYIVHGQSIDLRQTRIAAGILLGTGLLTPAGLFRAMAEARQRGYMVHVSLTAAALLTTFLSVVAARAGWGLPGQAAAVLAATVLALPLLAGDGISAFPGWHRAQTDKDAIRAVWRLSSPMFVLNLSGRLGLLSDNLIIAALLSSAAVAPFYLSQRIAFVVQLQLQNIGNATWAGLSDLHFRGEHEACRQRLLELTNMVTCAALVLLIPVAAYNRCFISLWVGPSMYASDLLTLMACLNAWLAALVNLWTWPITGVGQARLVVPYNLVSLVVNVAVSIGCTRWLGWIGPLAGTLVAMLAVNIWCIPRLLGRSFAIPVASLWYSGLRPLAAGVPCAAAVWLAAHRWPPVNWRQLVAACLASVLGTAAVLLASMPAATRDAWGIRLRILLSRK